MATKHWRGDAQAKQQDERLSITNAEPGDIFTVTINGKDISYTLTSADITAAASDKSNSQVAMDGLLTAIQDATSDATATPEWTEITASAVNGTDGYISAIKLLGPTDGKPFTTSLSTTDGGSYGVTVTTLRAGAAAQNEIQKVTLSGDPTGGTFTLTYDGQTTGNINYNSAAGPVETALEALSNIGAGDVSVTSLGGGSTGSPWTIEFTSSLGGADRPKITGDGTNLTGGADVKVEKKTEGNTGVNEVHRVTITWNSETTIPAYVSAGPQPWGNDTDFLVHLSPTGGDQSEALKDLYTRPDSVEATDVTVTQVSQNTTTSVYDVEFQGNYKEKNVTIITLSNNDSDNDATISAAVQTTGSASDTDEVQRVTILNGPTGGTFTLTYAGQTTAGIAYNASAGTVENAIELLSNVTDVTVTLSGNVYEVTFVDPGADVSLMTADASSLTGSNVDVETTQEAADAVNEVQEVALDDNPAGGTFTLTWDPGGGDETTAGIAYNATAAAVRSALGGLATPVANDFEVIGDAGGPWQVEFVGTYASTNVNAMTGDGSSLTGGGTQTLTKSTSQAAEGPNHWDVADNWDTGSVPTDNDVIVIDGSVSILYGLDQSSISPTDLIIKASFTGDIGLPRYNGTYWEYRDTELQIGNSGTGSDPMNVIIGEGDGSGSGHIRLNTGAKHTALEVHRTSTGTDGDVPAVTWRGTHASNTVDLIQGSLGIGYFQGHTATVLTLRQSYRDSADTDTELVVGDSVTLTNYTKTGGTATVDCAIPYLEHHAGEISVTGSGEVTEIVVLGGTAYLTTTATLGNNGTITGATAANPVVITTSTSHGLVTGDKVRITSVGGMTEINDREFTVVKVTNTTFQLAGEDGSGHTAYTSGGTFGQLGAVQVRGTGTIDFSRSIKARSVAVPIEVVGDEAAVKDDGNVMTTSTYGTGEFAVQLHNSTQMGDLGGQNAVWVRIPQS